MILCNRLSGDKIEGSIHYNNVGNRNKTCRKVNDFDPNVKPHVLV